MLKIIENLRIRQIVYEYRELYNLNPSLSESEISKLLIVKLIKKNPKIYELRNVDDLSVANYMHDLFDKEITLNFLCSWVLSFYYKKYNTFYINSGNDLIRFKKDMLDLEKRISNIITKTPGIKRP